MALKPKEAYLHLVTGGFDNEKRREVRKLFAAPSEADSEEDDVTDEHDLDLAVGLLEEFYSIGVKGFSLQQAQDTLKIFGVAVFDSNDDLRDMLNSPRLRLHSNNDVWGVPDERHIENLKTQFCDCDEEAIAKRAESLKEQFHPVS
jgi:hypothetical protein